MKPEVKQKFLWFRLISVRVITIGFLTLGLLVLLSESCIWFEMHKYSRLAQKRFHQDRTSSLLTLIESSEFTLNQKNRALWTLGIIKDERALPKLESLVTGRSCDHSAEICQYELKKAILKTRGRFHWSGDVKHYEHVK
jgi:hypothetical protein